MDRNTEIADFLRTRRARVTPERAGLQTGHRARRVPGLRRDEVARLAGVSTEYYTRLEQGRAGHPSPAVVDALAQALFLEPAEREYMAQLWTTGQSTRSICSSSSPQRVRPGLYLTLQTLEHVPAYILGRRAEVLASNRLAREVLTDFESLPAPRRNLAHIVMLDPAARERLLDWEQHASDMVALLRFQAGRYPHDRKLRELVGELMLKSAEFSSWWSDHRVMRHTFGTKRFLHPLVGELMFSYEALPVSGDSDQTLVLFNAEPGSSTQKALGLLSS